MLTLSNDAMFIKHSAGLSVSLLELLDVYKPLGKDGHTYNAPAFVQLAYLFGIEMRCSVTRLLIKSLNACKSLRDRIISVTGRAIEQVINRSSRFRAEGHSTGQYSECKWLREDYRFMIGCSHFLECLTLALPSQPLGERRTRSEYFVLSEMIKMKVLAESEPELVIFSR